ncbi:hypothetical protein DMUE_3533 [Dictyocoela muelleri]|nr:hypothetical protein DMUE_3533 [Dictyocoela muelleri]
MIKDKFTDKVNHKYYFVDPETKANTQKIENIWLHLKKIKQYSYGISLDALEDYLNVFMFFHKYKNMELSGFLIIILNKYFFLFFINFILYYYFFADKFLIWLVEL